MRAAAIVLGMALSANVLAGPPTLKDLLRPDQNTIVNISPGGDYIAVGTRVGDKVYAAILDRKTRQVVRGLDPEEDGQIARLTWVSKDRILVMNARTGPTVEEAFLEPKIIAINVDGTKKTAFYASVVDTLRNDDEHILVSVCGKSSSKGCWSHVRKVDTREAFTGPRIADAPVVDAEFTADNAGNVRFAESRNNDDIQQLWLLRNDKWELINDEASTGIEVAPIGVSRDSSVGYLRSEQTDGPDVIERIRFDTAAREVVLKDARLNPSFIVWSADGSQPIGAAYGLGVPRARFWNESDPDAKLLRVLERTFPEDAVAFTSGSDDGQHVIVKVWSDRDPSSSYLLDRATGKTELILRSKPWLDYTQLAPAKSIELTARDGQPLTGYLTLPTNAGTAPPPLVVLPHGGPFGIQDEWSYDEEVQILATHGYAVLRVNFRGSGGFGRKFEESGYREWGKKMQADVTDATLWMVQQGKADPSRICIWGSSYGGYAAMMGAITSPDLYKCVVATAAVSDLNLMWKWGDIHQSRWGRSYLERAIGDDPQDLLEHSPVKHASEIKAGLMLVHGTRDARVSYEHAKAMSAALDKAGKKYESYFPRDETHGIYGDENREEYYSRVLKFLDAHIGAGRSAVAASAAPH